MSVPPVQAPLQIDHKQVLRLDQLMLIAAVTLVVVIIAPSAVSQIYSTTKEFRQSTELQRSRLVEQAHNVSRSAASMLSLTSATALRDNDFAFLANLVGPVVLNEKNILRVLILDGESHVVADTALGADKTVLPATLGDGQFGETVYQGHPVIEYRDPVTNEGRRIGTVIIEYSQEPLIAELARLEEARKAAVKRIIIRTAGLGLVFVIVAGVLAAFQSRRITQPLGKLSDEAMRLASGDLSARVAENHTAGSEVMTLGTVFNHMADRIEVLLQETRVKAETDQQIAIARAVQESLIPSRELLQLGRFTIAGLIESADECGGDWWTRVQIDDQRMSVCFGDVTGHGIAPALVASAACSCIVSGIEMLRGRFDTASLMNHLNKTIYTMARGQHQMSCCIASFDAVTGEVEITNAANPFPYIFHHATRKTVAHGGPSALIGESEVATFDSSKVQLAPGDTIVWYSDGVTEAENVALELYGTKRLRQAIERFGNLPADELRNALLADMRQHVAGHPPNDDRTIIVTRFGA